MRARPAIVLALLVLLAGGIAWLVAGSPVPARRDRRQVTLAGGSAQAHRTEARPRPRV